MRAAVLCRVKKYALGRYRAPGRSFKSATFWSANKLCRTGFGSPARASFFVAAPSTSSPAVPNF